ncbi:MAG: hypothetical protein J0626_04625, partial [Rhodospirillaceae bacterium]|nr:hypothetical protein [Rhodospirillaceae bacterium]
MMRGQELPDQQAHGLPVDGEIVGEVARGSLVVFEHVVGGAADLPEDCLGKMLFQHLIAVIACQLELLRRQGRTHAVEMELRIVRRQFDGPAEGRDRFLVAQQG